MKYLLVFFATLVMSVSISFAQSVEAKIIKILTDDLSSFKASEPAKSTKYSDGSMEISQSYQSGELMLTIKLKLFPKELLPRYKKEVEDSREMYRSMMKDFEAIDKEDQFGYLGMVEKWAMSFMLIQDRYQMYLSIQNAKGTEGLRNIYDEIYSSLSNLPNLTISDSSTQEEETKPVPEAVIKSDPEVEAKIIKILTKKLGSFKAIDTTKSKVISDGSTRISRSYQSREDTLSIRIHILTKEQIPNAKAGIVEMEEMYQKFFVSKGTMELKPIDTEDQFGFLMFNSYDKIAGSMMLIQGRYMITLQVKRVEGIEDIRKIHDKISLSLSNIEEE